MKVVIRLLLFVLFVISGCDKNPTPKVNERSYMQNINARIAEINSEIAQIEELSNRIGTGYTISTGLPPMLTDVLNVRIGKANLKTTKANLEMTEQNLEASQRLIESIERFDKSSTTLSRWMLCLTIIIALLTAIMTLCVIVQIKDTPTFERVYERLSLSSRARSEAPREQQATTQSPKNTIMHSSTETNLTETKADAEAQDPHSTPCAGERNRN